MKKIISLVVLFSSIIVAQSSTLTYQINAKFNNQSSSTVTQTNEVNSNLLLPEQKKKSAGLAILYSMILPGMGELYADAFDSGKYFTITDGVLWSVFAGFNIYGNWQKDNYIAFAKTNAGIDLNGKESDFIANVGIYASTDEYNRIQELNRDFGNTYNASSQYWNWVNNDKRKEFRDIWSSSESAFTNVRFVAGALILNRIVSVINAVRLVAAYNKNITQQLSWNVYFDVKNKPTLPQSLNLNFTTRF